MVTRRDFLEVGAAVSGALLVPWNKVLAQPALSLAKYVDALPIPPAIDMTAGGVLPLTMAPGAHQFHRDLLPTVAWGYGGAGYLGPTIVAQTGVPITVEWTNNLPSAHILPIDTTLHWANPAGPGVPAVAHLHGGFTLPQFDGHPEQWFTPGMADTGHHFVTNVYEYSNAQRATTLWYHDHALGITRSNVYAGLAAFYFLRDAVELGLGLPSGPYEVPIVIQDRMFNADGSLFYSPPTNGLVAPYPHPVWIPEFFGNTPVVNGKAYPYLDVEPRRYRFRFLNGSNARFYSLRFDLNGASLPFHQIGTDQGFLGAAVPLSRLLIAPGERADVVMDFAGLPLGSMITLVNSAKVPFPNGRGGQLPQIMQFRVNLPLSGADPSTPPAGLALPAVVPLVAGPGTVTRDIMLIEKIDPLTGVPLEALLNDRHFMDPVEESPAEGATEVWQFINTTGDAHPMHTHLVQFQIVNRQAFNSAAYLAAYTATGVKPPLAPYLLGAPRPPALNEAGWKDTAIALPGEVLRVIQKFDLPPGKVELPRQGGMRQPQYVFHCHILEHEDNEMMRPYEVSQSKKPVA